MSGYFALLQLMAPSDRDSWPTISIYEYTP
jgi:hypothetical protein